MGTRTKTLLNSTGTVMDALGGNQRVALITKRSPTAVSNWRSFKTFPSDTFVVLNKALGEKGMSAPPSLWRMVEVMERVG